MRSILQKPALRYVFAANMISMFGSGMNTTAVAWFILQKTHSEVALGTFALLQTLPALLTLPFTGVIIDREDRRMLVMALDSARAVIILVVALLAFSGRAQVWQLYLMNTLVSAGFWMFWPTITALIQELTPDEEFVHANTFLLAGVQGGWLIAGAIVGWIYNRIGLGGILLVDFSTYVISFCCYFAVRKGRQTARDRDAVHLGDIREDIAVAETAVQKFFRELKEGFVFLRPRKQLIWIGVSWALFIGAMMTGIVVTAPLSDKVYHAGAAGYGWLNAGWGTGAFVSALFAPAVIAAFKARRSIAIAMGTLCICMTLAPLSIWLALAVLTYGVMGSARGLASVAMNTALMEQVPKHFMGRVQNTFYFAGTLLQIMLAMAVGAVAKVSLVAGFSLIGIVYGIAFVSAVWPVQADRVPDEVTVNS